MPFHRPNGRARPILGLAAAVLLSSALTGCELLGLGGNEVDAVAVETHEEYGPCWPTYGDEVRAASMSADGSRVLYLSGERPGNLPDEASWRDADRAVYVRDNATGDTRYIAQSWDPIDKLPVWATDDPARSFQTEPLELPEDLADLEMARTSERFVLAVKQSTVGSGFSKLYTGMVPAAGARTLLLPDSGLSIVPVNDNRATEGIRLFTLSDDGSKLAVIAGVLGEVRVYDFDAQQLITYTIDADGDVEVGHDLPPAATGIDTSRVPAVATAGAMRLTWSPGADRLAIARDAGVGESGLAILDVATGGLTALRDFPSSTLPDIVWAADGNSLFVMTTQIAPPSIFGETALRRIASAEGGEELFAGGRISRPPGYRTEPSNFAGFGDDEHFVFTWEGALWRLDTPGGDTSKASYIQVTPAEMPVMYRMPSVSPTASEVLFIVNDRFGRHIGRRLHALEDRCPLVATPEDQPVDTAREDAAPGGAAPADAAATPPSP